MNISITGRDAKPRVINVKQYASGVDDIIFTIEADLPIGDITGYIVSDKYRQDIDFTPNATGGVAQWHVASVFTQASGTVDIQLELTDGENVWRSDVMVLIVSESTNGTTATPTPTPDTDGQYQTIYAHISTYSDSFKHDSTSERVFSDGVTFMYE